METYSKADIEKLINDCEVLFLPEDTEIEFVSEQELENPRPNELELIRNLNLREIVIPSENPRENQIEDFEKIYQQSKNAKISVTVNIN